ncbi:hypothetical protein [Sphingopyxis sp. NJF-3]
MSGEVERIARGLSEAQRHAILRIGDFGEQGVWTSASGINWISVALMMKKWGADKLLEGVVGRRNYCRLNKFGLAVRAYLQEQQQ